MPTARLQKLLEQLHAEVNQLDESGKTEKARLDGLISEIETTLSSGDEAAQASFLDGLQLKFVKFAEDHPTTAGVTNRLMQTLADMGI